MIIKIEGEPQPWPKKIITRRGKHPMLVPRDKEGKFRRWRDAVLAQVSALHLPPFSRNVPLAVGVAIFIRRPKSVTRLYPTTKPDDGNITYALDNILQGALYVDDAQIVYRIPTGKFYATDFVGIKYWINAIKTKPEKLIEKTMKEWERY